MSTWPSGVIEGFYGRPWSWDERLMVMAAGHGWGMTDYVYAPKDDPKHRHQWREPYDDTELDGFARLVAADTLRVGFAISPGLSIDCDSADDRAMLAAKVDQVVALGVGFVVLALDDIPFGGGEQGAAQARLTTWLHDHVAGRADVALVPTEYVGTNATPYLAALAAGVPAAVPIAWTGDAVVNDTITTAEAAARAAALGGRPPLVWDNYPVNDGLMTDRLNVGPLRGRDAGLVDACSGYLANPMVQPTASLLPLASIAAWRRGDDPLAAWAAEADRRGWRVFAEACDGAVPQSLVAAGDVSALREWFTAAAACTAPGLEEECAPWLAQVHDEASVGLAAIDVLERPGDMHGGLAEVTAAFVLGMRFKALAAARVSVMGDRRGLRPVLGQAGDGTWTVRRASLTEDTNAVDAVVRLAFDALASP